MKGKIASGMLAFAGFLLLGEYVLSERNLRPSEGSTAGAPQVPLDRTGAVEHAVEEARALGLRGEPARVSVRRMSLARYDALTGFEAGPAAAEHGLDPRQMVWVVGIRGAVEWAGPGQVAEACPDCKDSNTFDNVTIVLSEATGEKLGSYAAGPGQPVPVGDGEASLENGAPPPEPEPTATPDGS